jgi:hypothetical protein
MLQRLFTGLFGASIRTGRTSFDFQLLSVSSRSWPWRRPTVRHFTLPSRATIGEATYYAATYDRCCTTHSPWNLFLGKAFCCECSLALGCDDNDDNHGGCVYSKLAPHVVQRVASVVVRGRKKRKPPPLPPSKRLEDCHRVVVVANVPRHRSSTCDAAWSICLYRTASGCARQVDSLAGPFVSVGTAGEGAVMQSSTLPLRPPRLGLPSVRMELEDPRGMYCCSCLSVAGDRSHMDAREVEYDDYDDREDK